MRVFLIICFISASVLVFGQKEKKHIRKGNNYFESAIIDSTTVDSSMYNKAEVAYRKALDKKQNSFEATFNLGDALFKQGKYDEAAKQFKILASTEKDKEKLGAIYHNLGNSMLMQGKLDEGIDAYKEALRNNPSDKETKYNLAYAQQMKQQQQNQQQQNQDQNQEQKDQEDKKDQEQQQQQDKNKQEQEKQQQQQQQEQQKMPKEDAERMLQAIEDDEKKTQEKVKQQVQPQRIIIEKDW